MKLRELVNGDVTLIGSSDVHSLFELSDLECTMNFLQIYKERIPERFTDQVFLSHENHPFVFREVFDCLSTEQISFELEDVSKLLQGWVVVAIKSRLTSSGNHSKGLPGL